MKGWQKGLLIGGVAVGLMIASALAPDYHATAPEHMPEGEHWSLLAQFFPGLMHNVQMLLGTTWVEGEQVQRVSHIFMALLVSIFLLVLAFRARKKLKSDDALVPEKKLTAFSFFDNAVDAILGLMEGIMGRENAIRYFPLIGSVALFILFSNLLGLVPGFVPPTDILNTTLALGIVIFVATHYYGVKAHGPGYFKHFMGPVIKWYALPIMLLMLVIETISHFVRPASLGIRLMGNIMGDHRVLFVFLGFGVLFVPLPVMVLGLIVAVVQTLVFSLLSIVYISLAIEH